MLENNNSPQNSRTLVDKIENQLQDILSKKKEEIERSLEDRIRQERDEAQRKLAEIENDYESEKESLINYRSKFSEIESHRDEIKTQIKTHLELAVSYQTEISGLTGKTLDELKRVGELNQQLDEYQRQAEAELTGMKNDLESKYGIVTALPESIGQEDTDFNLEQELTKLKKIKELLGTQGVDTELIEKLPIPEEPEGKAEEAAGEESLPPDKYIPEVPSDPVPAAPVKEDIQVEDEKLVQEPQTELSSGETEIEPKQDNFEQTTGFPEEPSEAAPVEFEFEPSPPVVEEPVAEPEPSFPSEEQQINIQAPFIPQAEVEYNPSEEIEEVELKHPAFDSSPDDVSRGAQEITFSAAELQNTEMDPVPAREEAPVLEAVPSPLGEREKSSPLEANFQDVFEKLEQYRKGSCTEDNGDVSFFQYEDKIIIDGECIVSSLTNSLEAAKKLYQKLNETESPKEQFFIKQDIIRHQEILRKLMLSSIKMLEKESCSLPLYTREVLNVEVLKTILEKVSMENWSDEQDFVDFDKYAKSLKDNYYTRITPPAQYIRSILDELEK